MHPTSPILVGKNDSSSSRLDSAQHFSSSSSWTAIDLCVCPHHLKIELDRINSAAKLIWVLPQSLELHHGGDPGRES
jgi:hypothetical protein